MTQTNSKDTVEVRKKYYASGALFEETPYVNGKAHGIQKVYCESGALSWEAPYENGKMHGIVRSYYGSGALCLEVPYENGEMHGIGKGYDKDKSNIDCLTLYNRDQEVVFVKI